jgi:hypothetical protein
VETRSSPLARDRFQRLELGKKARRGPQILKNKFFTILWLACLTLAAAKYPPGLRWREINRGAFTIIFPAARAAEAETALAGAENLNEKLSAFWRAALPGRIRIILDDSTDQSNGFATFFPFNLVGVNLPEPPPDSELAGSRSWLELVLAHELTHLFTLNAASEPFRRLRRVFGSQPVLYPAAQLPPWVIEGLGIYGESRSTEDGRLNHPPYPLMLGAVRRDGLFPGWREIGGIPAAWPGPAAKYLFGAGFMLYLSEKYGADSLRQYLERSTSRLVLFSSSRDFKKTFGETLGKLWEDYRNPPPAADSRAESGPAPEPLVGSGFSNQYPCPLGGNGLAYYRRDYQDRGAVAMLDMKSGREKILFKLDAVNGLSFAAKENKIFLSASEYFRSFSDFSDLYEFGIQSRKLKRLSRGLRLSQPIKKENSDKIYCVQRREGRYHLALFDTQKGTVQTLSRPFAGVAQPSLSPDGSMIASAVKPDGGPWGIGLFASSGELSAFISSPGADCSQPHWQDNQTLYFIQAGTETSRLASLSLAGNGGSVCADPRLGGLRQFAFSGEGKNVYFTYFSGRGLEIARLDLDGLPFSPQELSVASSIPETQVAAPKIASRPYRFWRDLLPRYWSPAWRLGGDEFQAGILTGGQDASGIHSFSLEGYYGFSSRLANVVFHYVYDGLFPTLSLSYTDNSVFYHDHDYSLRSQELKLASSWPLRIRRRSQLYGYADLHLERRSAIYDSGTYEYRGSHNGIRLGLEFNSSREYYDSISQSDGARLTLQYSIQPSGFGNEFSSRSAQADLRHYIPLFRPGVLAWRLALAKSWNPGYYAMGGGEGEAGNSLGENHPFDLLRGFPAGFQWGDHGYLFNLEYRLPLFKIEKAVLPAVSLDRVYLNTFFDMGRLWHGSYSASIAYSVGTEVVLRLAFGGAAVADLALGIAHGFGPYRKTCLYLRLGRSF